MLRTITSFFLDELHALDGIAEGRNLSDNKNLRKVEVINDLERTTLLEDVSWSL